MENFILHFFKKCNEKCIIRPIPLAQGVISIRRSRFTARDKQWQLRDAIAFSQWQNSKRSLAENVTLDFLYNFLLSALVETLYTELSLWKLYEKEYVGSFHHRFH